VDAALPAAGIVMAISGFPAGSSSATMTEHVALYLPFPAPSLRWMRGGARNSVTDPLIMLM
jgi:hypothetical protein